MVVAVSRLGWSQHMSPDIRRSRKRVPQWGINWESWLGDDLAALRMVAVRAPQCHAHVPHWGTSLVGLLDPALISNDDLDHMPLMSFRPAAWGRRSGRAVRPRAQRGVRTPPVFARGRVELLSRRLVDLAFKLDMAYDNHRRISGQLVQPLQDRPSDYLRHHFRVSAFASEQPGEVMAQMGPMLMFGGDLPHTECYASPLLHYQARCREQLDDETAARFFGQNLAELLYR